MKPAVARQRAFFVFAVASDSVDDPRCSECETKREACEKRAQRWIVSLCRTDEQLRFLLNVLDHHRARNKRLEWVENLRERLKCLIDSIR
jgi:hypothetical protein